MLAHWSVRQKPNPVSPVQLGRRRSLYRVRCAGLKPRFIRTQHSHPLSRVFSSVPPSLFATRSSNNSIKYIIPGLHDQAGSTSCYILAGRASLMVARWLLCADSALCRLHVYTMFARRLLDVCSMFARSCKPGIRSLGAYRPTPRLFSKSGYPNISILLPCRNNSWSATRNDAVFNVRTILKTKL